MTCCQLKLNYLVLVSNYSRIFMISITHSLLLLILKLNTKILYVVLSFYKKNLWDGLASGREKIDNCANSCIISVLIVGVMLLNQRVISYFKCRIFYKQKLLCEFRECVVITLKSFANCLLLAVFFFQKKLFAKAYVNFLCSINNNRMDKFKIVISLPHRDYPY